MEAGTERTTMRDECFQLAGWSNRRRLGHGFYDNPGMARGVGTTRSFDLVNRPVLVYTYGQDAMDCGIS